MAILQVDPGGEKYLPFAKRKLQYWKKRMIETGQRYLQKVIIVSDGSEIYLHTVLVGAGFRDRIRITGGVAYVPADPFFPLWSIQSAVMPGTRDGVTPSISWSPTVQHVSALYTEADGSYLRRHWLVICRYCKRVAEYTWDESGVPSGGNFIIDSAFVSNVSDGSSVTLQDTDADGNDTQRVIDIDPSLVDVSTANDWGWIDWGPSDLHPGPQEYTYTWGRAQTAYSNTGNIFDDPPNPYPYHAVTDITNTCYLYDHDFNVLQSQAASGSVLSYVYADGTLGPANGFPDKAATYSGTVPYDSTTNVSPGTYNNWGQNGGLGEPLSFIVDPIGAVYQSLVDAQALIVLAWEARLRASVQNIVQAIEDMLTEKLSGTTLDVSELRPYESAETHENIRAAVALSPLHDGTFRTTYNSIDLEFSVHGLLDPALLPASIYGATVGITSSPSIPPPPDTPWTSALLITRTEYSSTNKVFANPADVDATVSHLSRSTVPPLLFGTPEFLAREGLYAVMRSDVTATITEATTFLAVVTDATLDGQMKAACVGPASTIPLDYAAYWSRFGSKGHVNYAQLKDYRSTVHHQVNGSYEFDQPAIE